MQQQQAIPAPERATEQKFTTSETTSSDMIDRIGTIQEQKPEYWCCGVAKHSGTCLCETGEEPSIVGGGPPGASRENPVKVSTKREHWYEPLRCDKDGNLL